MSSLSRRNTLDSQQANRDKKRTSYGIIPTPPSPSRSTPSLKQSGSNSSTSPPQPTTPLPRDNRSRTRYPADLGRVPLHRRGTSGTYEYLEDLLREAGYKETRVFTPETERIERFGGENVRDSIAGGVGAVVGFLSGLVPGSSKPSPEAHLSGDEIDQSPPSPLARKTSQQKRKSLVVEPKSPSRSTTPVPHSPLAEQRQTLYVNNPSYTSLHRVQYLDPSRNSRPHTASPLSPPSPNPRQTLFHPRASRASAYLRHVASAPNMPQRPRSTPPQGPMTVNESDEEPYFRRGNGEGEEEPLPPLPQTWLESVARAVLFGGVGAYIGGPSASNSSHPTSAASNSSFKSPTTPAIRYTKGVLQRTRSGLSDHTNRGLPSASTFTSTTSALSSRSMQPPVLLARVGRSRSERSEGAVSKTRVVCKSAPGSRATSRSRASGSGERDDKASRKRGNGKDKERRDIARGRKERKGGGDAEGVPSLARTVVETDEPWKKDNRYLSGWGIEASDEEEQESEEEDELDLARMLVNPKRQKSIKSLRKHLAGENGTAAASLAAINQPGYGSGNSRTFRRWTAGGREDWEEDSDPASKSWGWPRGKTDRRRGSQVEDDTGGFTGFDGDSSRVGTGKSTSSRQGRLGLPSNWTFGS
ncbi:hypothetical protein C8J56DRAFT_954274 [Mycena floridula]|nr:hypothetical protein C8J56DRAFT_954274 [Mycena floridula]